MNITKAVNNTSTLTELKRVASPYVIDYRGLSEEEIRAALIKTAPQYYYRSNVEKAVRELFMSEDRNTRIIAPYILKHILLQRDGYMSPKRETEDLMMKWEQSVVDRSNEDLLKKTSERTRDIEMFHFVLKVAWEQNKTISVDEFNLLDKIRQRLRVTPTEHRIIEAKIGNFPKQDNTIHTRSEIEDVRRLLQANGLLFSIRDQDGVDFDVIPDEVAATLKDVLRIEIRNYGYSQLLRHKAVRSKSYLIEVLQKAGIKAEKNPSMEDLFDVIIEQVNPKVLLGGTSPRDGLATETLSKWCGGLSLNVSGTKNELIDRIIAFYDALNERSENVDDEREILFPYFTTFASRDIACLRGQQLIEKDIEIERKFEEVTNFIFEKFLGHNPLNLVGTAHADGALSYKDKVIYWDNKSKESPVNLKDHIRQIDGYIRLSEKAVAGFLLIGPNFTPESSTEAMRYQVENGIMITLITASELKELSEEWKVKTKGASQNSFPLGYLLQPGRFNLALVADIQR